MKFKPTDRMLQLGVAPTLTTFVKEAYPGVSASLWQRNAKTAHHRIIKSCPEIPGEGTFARQGHLVASLAALLLGFHVAAPEEVDLDEATFARMVDLALRTPIFSMLFAGGQPFTSEGTREIEQLLEVGSAPGSERGLWAGSLRFEGDTGPEGGQELVCCVSRCGLMQMCVDEKRRYLLKHLCAIEAAQAACCGVRMRRTACIATGDRTCELHCMRG